ncbi:MAG: hypothetical protein RIS75_139, partial [Actinomycetota bacterium]
MLSIEESPMFTTLSAVSLKRVIGIAVTTVLTLGVMTAVPLSAQAVDAPSIVITQVTETASSDTDPKSVHVP